MTDILSNNKIPRIYAYTEPQFKETPWKNRRQGKGLIKVGFTGICYANPAIKNS